MLVRFFRLVWPGIVLFVVVGAYALSLHYFEASPFRAGGVAALWGFIVTFAGFVLAIFRFPQHGKKSEEIKIEMSLMTTGLLSLFVLVASALALDTVVGLSMCTAYGFVAYSLVSQKEDEWTRTLGGETPQWFWVGHLLQLGVVVFVLFPNIVGWVSVMLCAVVFSISIDRKMLNELIASRSGKPRRV